MSLVPFVGKVLSIGWGGEGHIRSRSRGETLWHPTHMLALFVILGLVSFQDDSFPGLLRQITD